MIDIIDHCSEEGSNVYHFKKSFISIFIFVDHSILIFFKGASMYFMSLSQKPDFQAKLSQVCDYA